MKKIVILGAGESGAGAAVLAKKEGFEVFVSDMSKIKDNYIIRKRKFWMPMKLSRVLVFLRKHL